MGLIFRSKLFRFIVVPLFLVVVLAIVGGGWYFSGVLEEDGLRVDHTPDEFTLTVESVSEGTITIRQPAEERSEALEFPAIWGITDGDKYGQVGNVVAVDGDLVTRSFTQLVGSFQVGDLVRMDRSSFPPNPLAAHGLDYTDFSLTTDLGVIGAWHVGADSDTWAVLVHGRTSTRETSLRLLDDLRELSVTSLVIDYRNDAGAPASESGYYDFGTTEWEDVETAVQYALDNGAEKIILIGYSMGGGIIANYQLKSELAENTVAMVLDSPMLNFGRTVDAGAEERSVPAPITFAAKQISTMRFGIDWDALDYLSRADEFDVPILVFHGDADDTVPIETSTEFAAAVSGLAEMHVFEEAEHVAAWNWDSERYESLFRGFIERVR